MAGIEYKNDTLCLDKLDIGVQYEMIEDPEGRNEITTDFEGKIISYRDADGVKHEEAGIESKNISTNSLNLTDDGMSEFQQALKNAGFQPGGAGDWSDAKELHIEEPYCAKVNFTGIDDIPQQKYSDNDRPHAYMEFYDINGNYFKKEVLINAQGRSTMGHPKKNIAIDICNNNGWDDDDTFSLQIGDWVPQDSFHLKAFYNDPFRCLSPVTYKLYDEVVRTRGTIEDYVWKRALINVDGITATSNAVTTAADSINTGAKCVPAGFPCIVYLNGTFYGIYSWQLKKHRDNYHMKKTNKKHIHLDGVINQQSIFNANGNGDNIWWNPIAITIPGEGTKEGFEIRNPKSIVYAEAHDGSYKYDADAEGNLVPAGNTDGSSTYDTWVAGSYPLNKIVTYNGSQFINTIDGNTAEPIVNVAKDINTDKSPDFKNKTGCGWINCTISVNVKSAIIKLSTLKSTLDAADATYEASEKTAADIAAFKAVFETYLDTKNLIDYLIVSDISNNYDGWGLNWQWLTYNGTKWFIGMYDCDGVFGNWWELTQQIEPPKNAHFTAFPINYIIKYYNTELEARYKDLRDLNILSTSHIVNLVTAWLDRVGNKETFDKEWSKWPSFIKNDSVMRLEKWIVESISNMDAVYHYNQN